MQTKHYMGSKEVLILRDARRGDFGWNETKPPMYFIEIPGEGRRTIPKDHIRTVKLDDDGNVVKEVAGEGFKTMNAVEGTTVTNEPTEPVAKRRGRNKKAS